LPLKEVSNGFLQSQKADLCLALGSSLRVTPAADMPREIYKNGGKLVICNLQATPLDNIALRLNGMINVVMEKLMNKLNLEIPKFILKRRLEIKLMEDISGGRSFNIRGIDTDGTNYSLFSKVVVDFPDNKEKITLHNEPSKVSSIKDDAESNAIFHAQLSFQGHYGEPTLPIEFSLDLLSYTKEIVYAIESGNG